MNLFVLGAGALLIAGAALDIARGNVLIGVAFVSIGIGNILFGWL